MPRALHFRDRLTAAAAVVLAATAILAACDTGPAAAPEMVDAGGGPGPLEAAPPPLIPVDQRRDAASSPVVFDALRGGLWTANHDAGSVSWIDVDHGGKVAEIAVGRDVRSVALSPDARFVAAVDREGAAVALIDAETRVVARTLQVGRHPHAAVWDTANPAHLYVSVEDDDEVVMIDRTVPAVIRHIPVGRVPAGLAASRAERAIYVAHRIDPKISVIDLATRALTADIALADQPADDDATRPQGRPFAFESLAWTADGGALWAPHELLSRAVRPFQFQRVLFPAISVIDAEGKKEVETDPADPNGAIAGRKNLFDAMNVLDDKGNTTIVSQPCAAALHPNGLVGYALACASEDLLVFDATRGILTDVVRDLPGDHPVGIALDDTGQRAWVLAEQSHTLTMIDLGDGSPIAHARTVGAPIALVARDPVDPELREGEKLFYRANSSKGPYATTGNDWMSCGGCHLDGFVTTNAAFFEALAPKDATKDAQIGHAGLSDFFSSAPTPDDPSFDPHDVVVALLEQGGLAPDRSGAKRDGAVDPRSPPPEVRQMASRLARVIARDLPLGPSWLLPGRPPQKVDYDGAWCGRCHVEEYAAWSVSVHAHAAEDPMVLFGVGVEVREHGGRYGRLCAGCHDPVSVRAGDASFGQKRGVTCVGCHETTRLIRAGGNADIEADARAWTDDHAQAAAASLETLRKPEFCGGCHQQFVPGTGLLAIGTLTEHPADGAACIDCHMPPGAMRHAFPGGNIYLGQTLGIPQLVEAQRGIVQGAVSLTATRNGAVVHVDAKNHAGHAFPTGVTDIREPWIEVQAVDAQGRAIAHYGGVDGSGLLPANAARFGMDIAKPDGTVLLLHELSQSTRIPFDRHIAQGATVGVDVPVPSALPAGAVRFEAVLYYHNVRTPYFRAAMNRTDGSAPEIEVARAPVP